MNRRAFLRGALAVPLVSALGPIVSPATPIVPLPAPVVPSAVLAFASDVEVGDLVWLDAPSRLFRSYPRYFVGIGARVHEGLERITGQYVGIAVPGPTGGLTLRTHSAEVSAAWGNR